MFSAPFSLEVLGMSLPSTVEQFASTPFAAGVRIGRSGCPWAFE
jgi:hypothetical protein